MLINAMGESKKSARMFRPKNLHRGRRAQEEYEWRLKREEEDRSLIIPRGMAKLGYTVVSQISKSAFALVVRLEKRRTRLSRSSKSRGWKSRRGRSRLSQDALAGSSLDEEDDGQVGSQLQESVSRMRLKKPAHEPRLLSGTFAGKLYDLNQLETSWSSSGATVGWMRHFRAKYLPRILTVASNLTAPHPNVLSVHHVYNSEPPKVVIVMEYAEGGDLDSYMEHARKLDSSFKALDWSHQVAHGLKWLHENYIAHRNLRLEHIMVMRRMDAESQRAQVLKIGGFDYVKLCAEPSTPNKPILTTVTGLTDSAAVRYAAPEVLAGEFHDPRKSDVFALGVIIFRLFADSFPFETMSREEHEAELDAHYQWRERLRSNIDDTFYKSEVEELLRLLDQAFETDFGRRFTVDQLLHSPLWKRAKPIKPLPGKGRPVYQQIWNDLATLKLPRSTSNVW